MAEESQTPPAPEPEETEPEITDEFEEIVGSISREGKASADRHSETLARVTECSAKLDRINERLTAVEAQQQASQQAENPLLTQLLTQQTETRAAVEQLAAARLPEVSVVNLNPSNQAEGAGQAGDGEVTSEALMVPSNPRKKRPYTRV